MRTPAEGAVTAKIGGKDISDLEAALIAQQADRLGILPCLVGDVEIPDPAPARVVIAGLDLSITTSARLAEAADQRGILLEEVIAEILREKTDSLDMKARSRGTKRPLEGTCAVSSDSPSREGRRGSTRPENVAKLAHLLGTAELGLKDAVSALTEADELLKEEPALVAGVDREQLRTFSAVAEANRSGIERLEARVRQVSGEAP